jgi:hypothetical protein
MTTQHRVHLSVLAGLILLYWFVRFHHLESFAFFLDEGAHLDWAQWVWRLQPFQAATDGKWLNVLLISAFWPFNGGILLSRASGLLVTTCGFASLLAIAYRVFSFRTALIAAALYIFLPMAFFFERMALADPLSTGFVIGATGASLYAYHTSKRSTQWAVLGGLALASALLSKLSNLVFLCIPVLAAVTLLPLKQGRSSLRIAATTYISMALALVIPVSMLYFIGHSDFGFDLVGIRSGVSTELQFGPLVQSLLLTAQYYLPFPLWLIIALGVVIGLWRGGRQTYFVGSVLLVTLAVLFWQSASTGVEARYLLVYMPLWVLLAAIGWGRLLERRPLWLTAGLTVLAALPGLLFVGRAFTEPDTLPLSPADRWQYITGWPSGYGFNDVAEAALQQNEPLTLVTLDLGGQQRLKGYLLGRTPIITPLRFKRGADLTNVWLLLDRPKDDEDIERLNLNLVEIARYPRPGGESAVVVYRVEP